MFFRRGDFVYCLFLIQVLHQLQNVLGVIGAQLFKFRQQRGRLKRGSGIRIEEFVRRDAEVFTDVEKARHGRAGVVRK